MKHYTYTMDTSITRALSLFNRTKPKPIFSPIDANILCLVKNFPENSCYMSNEEFSAITVASVRTVQRSIDNLVGIGLLTKSTITVNKKARRQLTYNDKTFVRLCRSVNLTPNINKYNL